MADIFRHNLRIAILKAFRVSLWQNFSYHKITEIRQQDSDALFFDVQDTSQLPTFAVFALISLSKMPCTLGQLFSFQF